MVGSQLVFANLRRQNIWRINSPDWGGGAGIHTRLESWHYEHFGLDNSCWGDCPVYSTVFVLYKARRSSEKSY